MTELKMLPCPICGREFKSQGGLNLHVYHCKVKNGTFQTDKVTIARIDEKRNVVEKCNHEYRLLNLAVSIERVAYNHNFREVCKICQELR